MTIEPKTGAVYLTPIDAMLISRACANLSLDLTQESDDATANHCDALGSAMLMLAMVDAIALCAEPRAKEDALEWLKLKETAA